ncbi:MAG: FAD:protein FMN transferase, partial [Bifidobacteriaceae bacterium]|nr:FAD:protein FMN transferase [Bifidobacteriaceae bacterium]
MSSAAARVGPSPVGAVSAGAVSAGAVSAGAVSADAARFAFPAMGTLVKVIFGGPMAATPGRRRQIAADLRQLIEQIEAELSIFRPDSDIARLNRQAGGWVAVGSHTAAALRAAARLRRATDGLFDPAMPGRALAVRPIDPAPPDQAAAHSADQAAAHSAEARLGPAGAFGPAGGRAGEGQSRPLGIDLGGIGKGYAADAALALCRRAGATSALVAVGASSIAAAGQRPAGGPWRVALRSPGGGRDQAFGV